MCMVSCLFFPFRKKNSIVSLILNGHCHPPEEREKSHEGTFIHTLHIFIMSGHNQTDWVAPRVYRCEDLTEKSVNVSWRYEQQFACYSIYFQMLRLLKIWLSSSSPFRLILYWQMLGTLCTSTLVWLSCTWITVWPLPIWSHSNCSARFVLLERKGHSWILRLNSRTIFYSWLGLFGVA